MDNNNNVELNGMVWNGMKWKKKDEEPEEDEGYEKPFFLEPPGIQVPSHPMENHPDWPYVIDPELEAMPYDDPFKEDDEPLFFEDMRVDPTKPDHTYIPPWLRPNIPPPTRASIREGEKLINPPCYIDDDPRNLWLYKDYHGPVISSVVRQEWGAQGWKPKKPLNIPVKHVRFTYTNGPTADLPQALGILQEMQKQHKAQGMEDIAYNHMIGQDGAIYEGRGWYVDAERPEEFNYLKGDCLDIAYLGNFSENLDSPKLDLIFVLNEGDVNTFFRPRQWGMIPDITLASELLLVWISAWRVNEDFTASDHQYIIFDVLNDSDPPWILLKSAIDIIRYAVEIRVLDPNFKVIQYRPLNQQIKPK